MEIEFIQARLEDQDECLQMIRSFYAIDGYPFEEKKVSDTFQAFLNDPNAGRFWLLKIKDQVIGYLILTIGFSFEYLGKDAFIDEFYLKEPFRGKGYGSNVLEQLPRQAAKLAINAIHLEVERTNEAGQKLYKKSGFEGNNRALLTKLIER